MRHNVQVQGRGAVLSRSVPCNAGLGLRKVNLERAGHVDGHVCLKVMHSRREAPRKGSVGKCAAGFGADIAANVSRKLNVLPSIQVE